MQTRPLKFSPLGGMCLSDAHAGPEHASWDVNGWVDGEYRDIRKGTRPILGVAQFGGQKPSDEGDLDWRGVFAFRTLWGAVRLLVVANVVNDTKISVGGTEAAPQLQQLFAGEIAFLLVDPTRFTDGGLALWTPVGSRPDAIIALGVFKWTTSTSWPGTGAAAPADDPRLASDASVFPLADWQPQFYVQRDKIGIFGHPSGAAVVDYNMLRAPVQTAFGAHYHFEVDGLDLRGGLATSSYSYFAGPYPEVSIFPVGATAFVVPKLDVHAWVDVTTAIPSQQESVPEWRIMPGRTTVRWDARQVHWSESEAPENIPVLMSSMLSPENSRYVAVAQVGEFIGLVLEDRTQFIDMATMGLTTVLWKSHGSKAPLSVIEIDNSLVFVNSSGIVVSTPTEERVVSSPFLDALFKNEARSTLPVPMARTESRLGLPARIDHDRLDKAVAWNDFARGWYCVAVTTVGALVENDLLIVWDYRRNRFSLMRGAAYSGDVGRSYFVNDPIASSLNGQYDCVPSFSFRGVTSIQDRECTRVFSANELGVFEVFDEDTDYVAVRWNEAAYWTKFDARYVSWTQMPIESVRVTPTVAIGDYQPKGLPNLRFTCWAPVFADNGQMQVFVEGERGSLQLIDASDILADKMYRQTQRVQSEMFTRETRNNKYLGLTGEVFDGSQVWQRGDYICAEATVQADTLRWWRVAVYDQRAVDVVPALLLTGMEAGAYVDRQADRG